MEITLLGIKSGAIDKIYDVKYIIVKIKGSMAEATRRPNNTNRYRLFVFILSIKQIQGWFLNILF